MTPGPPDGRDRVAVDDGDGRVIEPRRSETDAERWDRQLGELLQELRVALPGVQVLFAFLLTVPFTARFDEATQTQRVVYFLTLLCTAVATVVLMAPVALHRLRFRQGRKREIVEIAHRLTIAGLAALGLAVTGAVLLVTDVLFGMLTAVVTAGGALALIVALWWVMPERESRR
jgi:hypothetical protein